MTDTPPTPTAEIIDQLFGLDPVPVKAIDRLQELQGIVDNLANSKPWGATNLRLLDQHTLDEAERLKT